MSQLIKSFSPKLFLKARRPERFSDSVPEDETELDRSLLEFHLSSLTSRGQERDFERFARRLCEQEVCPNLLPQTGPTGGGDSKVDSETYPVADGLMLGWFVGTGRKAAQERWAFAFSAKEKWQDKVRSDVAKIAETDRGYKKAWFVTNQAVPDRKRAEVEDSLRKKHGIDVRILDRTWILDRVFGGKHEQLAAKELGVTALSRQKRVKGPLDARREMELEEVDKRVQDSLVIGQFGPALAEAALESALLARSLERSQGELEGRFSRAEEIAGKCGSARQRVEVAYQWAWTLYWWFEAYAAFGKQYSLVQDRVMGTENAHDLEELVTLWHLLHVAVERGLIDSGSASYSECTNQLIGELERLKSAEDRPSTALQAETLLHQMGILRRLTAKQAPDDELRALCSVVLRIQGLIGYPLESLVEIVSELGKVIEGSVAYDELFEALVEVAAVREGETRAARLLLNRGEHLLSQGRAVEAIATLGRSLARLYKHEARHDVVRALYLCGCAYDEIGLHWAARNTLLVAASVSTNDLWTYGEVTPYQAACYQRLKWIELRLGRIPHLLVWHELDTAIRNHLMESGYDGETLFKADDGFSFLLGGLLLRSNLEDVKRLEALPDILDQLGLSLAADALLYALGYEDGVRQGVQEVGENLETFVRDWRQRNPGAPVAEQPELYDEQDVVLRSRIFGCRITVECGAGQPCIEVGEALLAALESFLATGSLHGAMAREPELSVRVGLSISALSPFEVAVEEVYGRPRLHVQCAPFNPHELSQDQQRNFGGAIFNLTVQILSHIVIFRDFKRDLETLFRDERVADRAVAFSATPGVQANVLGASPKTRLREWIGSGELKRYSYQRPHPLEELAPRHDVEEDVTFEQHLKGPELLADLLDPNKTSHDQIATVSLIREPLWNRAGWYGAMFAVDLDYEAPPVLGLMFRDREAGRSIFVQWRQELGRVDSQERFRVTIIKGIDKASPYAYRMIIGVNPASVPAGSRIVNLISRIHRMDPETPKNLDMFLQARDTVGCFVLAPAFAERDSPEFDLSVAVGIHIIHARQAWEIGRDDLDAVGIDVDEDPVIPEDVESPPVLELLAYRREKGR